MSKQWNCSAVARLCNPVYCINFSMRSGWSPCKYSRQYWLPIISTNYVIIYTHVRMLAWPIRFTDCKWRHGNGLLPGFSAMTDYIWQIAMLCRITSHFGGLWAGWQWLWHCHWSLIIHIQARHTLMYNSNAKILPPYAKTLPQCAGGSSGCMRGRVGVCLSSIQISWIFY